MQVAANERRSMYVKAIILLLTVMGFFNYFNDTLSRFIDPGY